MYSVKENSPTCNIRDATLKFRAAGIHTSETVLGAGIEQGLYPFAICIHTKKGRRFEIYTKQLDNYLAERM